MTAATLETTRTNTYCWPRPPIGRSVAGLRVRNEQTETHVTRSSALVPLSQTASSENLLDRARNASAAVAGPQLAFSEIASLLQPSLLAHSKTWLELHQLTDETVTRSVDSSLETLAFGYSPPSIEVPETNVLLDEILLMDLRDDGFLPTSARALELVTDLALLSSATFGAFAGLSAQPWTIAPLEDGGLLPEWRGPGGELEVHISPTGAMAYVLTRSREMEHAYEGGSIATESDILALLATIFDA